MNKDKMNNESVNKALQRIIEPGACWHIIEHNNNPTIGGTAPTWLYRCKKCKKDYTKCNRNPDYFSKEGFWDVWEWFNEKYSIVKLMRWMYEQNKYREEGAMPDIVNYKVFARLLYNFIVAEGIIKGE